MLLKQTAEIIKPKEIDPLQLSIDLIVQQPILARKISTVLAIEEEDTQGALAELIKFLYLSAYYKISLTPSDRVDDIWHEFILFTKTYEQFCQKHFGRFIHHQPDDDTQLNCRRFSKLVSLYELNFGQLPIRYWPMEENLAMCGSCTSLQ